MMEHSIIPATLAAIEVVFLFLASLSVKANELMLASGNIEEYTLTHYPVRITNPESVDEKLSSALYAYLWTSHISSPATILDWDENTKQMTYRLGNSTHNQVVKMGVESFYKQDVQQVRGSSRGTMDTLRDIVIGYTFYKATTGGFK